MQVKDKKDLAFFPSPLGASLMLLLLYSHVAFAQDPRGSFQVKRVADGDTIVLADGRYARYLCINTPERGEPFRKEARAKEVGILGRVASLNPIWNNTEDTTMFKDLRGN
jgi:endonuclease YncB( thermonuclease family)